MDHVRVIDQEFVFGAKRPEIHFAVPLESKINLLEVTLSLVTRPGTAFSEAGCNDIRLYANDYDITEHYAAALRDIINSWDQTTATLAYRRALDRWLKFAGKLGAAYGAPDLAAEKKRASELVATKPLSSLIAKLGDTNHGWSGHLHILNFIHQFGLPYAISLTDVVHRFSAATGTPISVLDVTQLTVSSGRSPTLDSAYDLSVDKGRGAVSLHFELRYHDTLEDELAELRRQFEALRDRIDQRLDAIVLALSPGGQIQRRLTTVEQQVALANIATAQAERDVAGYEMHLQSLERSVREVRDLVKAL
jgi:hypothetical protein